METYRNAIRQIGPSTEGPLFALANSILRDWIYFRSLLVDDPAFILRIQHSLRPRRVSGDGIGSVILLRDI